MSDKKVTGILGKDGKITISAQLTSEFTPVTRANGDSTPLQKGRINIVDAESGEAEGFSGGSGKSASEIYRDAGEACGRDCRDDPRKDQISHLVPAGKKDMEAGKVLVTEGTGRNTQLDISARHV